MKLFLIWLFILVIVLIVLYFVLSRLYDYFSHREAKEQIEQQNIENLRKYELNQAALKSKKKMLESEIFAKTGMIGDIAEIKHLEKELEEVNELIDRISKDN
ncbi:hypothetical protein KYI11_07975 [Macrococcoides bohemicum]|uniref:Uncharacterized protein n=1 Tax=Macrococcoides bohemicum TaxID=1903056 RepID=A0A328A6X1_9STAP|nr:MULTISPECIES: hypothetical protein [Macrococcus]ATD30152.1 hypothetical protein BHM04_02725 [Macrococcus sp. IME1552]QRN50148.1 hypothetical protein HT586_08030 [Macrococcus bohemicus]QYA41576.1 hypothetical protein KYI11_07975 [Macrococcus bohemicus]QYA44001.1 hypothetical protein KYI13_07925 [Macrococcus bohemicus]RAK50293.1 hypothetical protein BHX94_02185 [Macrococcus bohemicus]